MSTISTVNLGNYGAANMYAVSDKAKSEVSGSAAEEAAKNGASAVTPDVDTFEKTQKTDSEAGVQKRLTADQLKEIQNQQTASFQKMLSSMLTSQAKKSKLATNGISADLFSDLTITPEQKLAAEQAISEDGEWGVNAVATRIVDMAMSLTGGDSSKVAEMRAAVEKGFQQATGQWGTSLPSICNDTHDEINRRFDYWEKNGTIDGYVYGATQN